MVTINRATFVRSVTCICTCLKTDMRSRNNRFRKFSTRINVATHDATPSYASRCIILFDVSSPAYSLAAFLFDMISCPPCGDAVGDTSAAL